MQSLLLFFAAFYSLLMPIFLIHWIGLSKEDRDLTDSEKRLVFATIVVATLFWPIVVPFAYLELLSKSQSSAKATQLFRKVLESTLGSQLC